MSEAAPSATFRGFVALPLAEPARDVLLEAQRQLRKEAERRRLDLRWARAEQIHVTITFLGNVLREHVPSLQEIVRTAAAEQPSIERDLSQIDFFGPPGRARVLQVPVPDGDGALGRLAARVGEAAVPLGVEREVRPYRPHLTLARFRRPAEARALIRSVVLPPTRVRFDRLVLFASQPGRDGSFYTELAESKFG